MGTPNFQLLIKLEQKHYSYILAITIKRCLGVEKGQKHFDMYHLHKNVQDKVHLSVNSTLVGMRIFVSQIFTFNVTVPTSITVINSSNINVKDGCHQSHLEHFVRFHGAHDHRRALQRRKRFIPTSSSFVAHHFLLLFRLHRQALGGQRGRLPGLQRYYHHRYGACSWIQLSSSHNLQPEQVRPLFVLFLKL